MYLCIDLGSTSFKTAVYDADLNLMGSGGAYLDYAHLGERVELTLEMVSGAVKSAVQEAVEAAGLQSADIISVAVTSQAQTFALRMGGAFVAPMISWQDSRAAADAEAMRKDPFFASFRDHASLYVPVSGLQLCLLVQVYKDQPEFHGAEVVPLPSFVMEKLTGQLVLDDNLAALSGLWSLPEKKWNDDYLQWLGLTAAQLPNVGPLPASAGTVQAGNFLGLPQGCPVYSAGNDQTAGAVAAELEREGGILITLGSAQVVYQWCETLPLPEEGVIRGSYPGGGFCRMLVDTCGGNQILRTYKQLGLEGFPAFFEEAKAGFASGASLPKVDAAVDQIKWSDESASTALKCAAVVDFLSERMAKMVLRLEVNDKPVYLTDGGGARQSVWRDCMEQKLGRKLSLRIAAPDLGAARMMQRVVAS